LEFKDMLSMEMITIEESELLKGIRKVVEKECFNEECVKEATCDMS
jgi:hypothetical protein